MFRRLLVTGGAGFIGSAFIRYGLQKISTCEAIINLDLLTYAADLKSLASIEKDPRYHFVRGNVCNEELVEELCRTFEIDAIVHFAAESHVDRSIVSPKIFYHTNVGGTLSLLEVVRRLPHLHLHHVSTDEVYGSLEKGCFAEISPYRPNSPYAASKAAADHFVRAYTHTYGLSAAISHCSNNYGPHQCSEKLIPCMIRHCVRREKMPIYGQGMNVRDWLYVEDHVEALWKILAQGKQKETYDIGAGCEMRNIDLVHKIIAHIAEMLNLCKEELSSLITFTADRPGHDFRYALDSSKIHNSLAWKPRHTLDEGLQKTIAWYLNNEDRLCHPCAASFHALS